MKTDRHIIGSRQFGENRKHPRPNRDIYRKNVTFIQQHTGIYTTTHWHLYNNTLAFIQQNTGIYTSHVFHPFSPKFFMALCHERHADK